MKTNYHTHTTWCDGKDTPEAVVVAAIDCAFDRFGDCEAFVDSPIKKVNGRT